MSHSLVFIESLTICILFLVTLYLFNFRHGTPQFFGHLTAIYSLAVLTCVLDIIWVLTDGKVQYLLVSYITHPIYLSSFTLISMIWCSYSAKILPFRFWKSRLMKFLTFLPGGIIILLNFLSPLTGWMFYLDENATYFRGPLYYTQIISYVYLIITTLLSLKAMSEAQLTTERKHYSSLAVFGVSPVILGALSIIAPPGGLPTMQFSILFALLLMFVEHQGNKITNDTLTGLANRHSLDFSIHEKINRHRKNGERFFILLGDMNDFKTINDTYGHMEGDRVLKVAADVLDSVAKEYGCNASRMGGDEFAIVITCPKLSTAAEMKERIQQAMDAASQREQRNLSISIGIAEYKSPMTLTQFLDQADRNLYYEKNHK